MILLTKVTDSNPRQKQVFSKTLVEQKRLGRTLPAIINGFSVSLARENGWIDESLPSADSPPTTTKDESLFLSDGSSEDNAETESKSKEPLAVTNAATTTPLFNPFAKPFNLAPASNPPQTVNGTSEDPSKTEITTKEPQPVTNTATMAPMSNPFAKAFSSVPASNPFQTAAAANAFKIAGASSTSLFNSAPESNPFQNAATAFKTPTPPTWALAAPSGTLDSPSIFSQPITPTASSNQSPTPSMAGPAFIFPQTASSSIFPFGAPSTGRNEASTVFLPPMSSSSDSTSLPTSSGSPPKATSDLPTSGANTTPSFTSFLGKSSSITNQPANTADQKQDPVSGIPGDVAKTSSNAVGAQQASFQFPAPSANSEAPVTTSPPQTLTTTQHSEAPISFFPQQTNSTTSIFKPLDTLSGQSSGLFNGTPSSADKNSTSPPVFNFAQPSFIPKPVIDNAPSSSNLSSKPRLSEVPGPSSLSAPLNTFFLKPSDTSNTSSTSTSTIRQAQIGPPKPDPRPQLLDLLADEVICENNGLLQQFLQYTLHPMVVEAITQVKGERIQAEIGW